MNTLHVGAIYGAWVLAGSLALAPAQAQTANVPSSQNSNCSALCDLLGGLFSQSKPAAPTQQPAATAPPATAAAADASTPDTGRHRPKHPHAREVAAKPAAPPLSIAADATDKPAVSNLIAALARHRVTAKALPSDAPDSERAGADFALVPAPLAHGADVVVPHFSVEYLHVVAGPAIHSIDDLRGRPVSLGLNGSSSQIVARRLFQSLGVEVKETPLDFANAADALDQGSIAAFVVLAPKGYDGLRDLPTDKGLHLVALRQTGTDGTPASLQHADYPKLVDAQDVATIGVDLALTAKRGSRAHEIGARLNAKLAGAE
jgi:hypothetical protein